MVNKRFPWKIVGFAAAFLLFVGMGHGAAQEHEIIQGGYIFNGDLQVDGPNVFVSTDPFDAIILPPGAVLDADIVFTEPNFAIWGKWHRETGADPARMGDYGLAPLAALTAGNSGYRIMLDPESSVINRAEGSDGIMALGSVDITIGRKDLEGITENAFVHGPFSGIFVDGLYAGDGKEDPAGRVPVEVSILNHGSLGSYAKEDLESSFGIWLTGGAAEDRFVVDNTGHIEGTESGLTVEGGFSDVAIVNTGVITSGKLGLSIGQVSPEYIWVQDPAALSGLIDYFSGQVTIDNHGEIIGERFTGIGIWGDGEPAILNNHETGLIKSNEAAVQLVGGGEIVNKGTIEGGVGIYIPNSTAVITHSGILKATGESKDAILFGPNAEGGLVTLLSSVDGNIRHAGDTAGSRVILADGGEDASLGNIDLGGKGVIRQTGGTWSLADVAAARITVEGGELRSDQHVVTQQSIDIQNDGRLAVSDGVVQTSNLVNRGILDFTGGTLTITGGLFDYAQTPQDFRIAGPGRPHLELAAGTTGVRGSETDNIRVLVIGNGEAEPGALTLKSESSTVSFTEKLFVGSGGALYGVGAIAGDAAILSEGLVQPGVTVQVSEGERSSIGTLSIAGNLDIEEGAVIIIKSQGNDQTSKISVEKDVAIEGGIVGVDSISGGSIADGSVHTFLTAGGTITGLFSEIVSLSPIYAFEMGRTDTDYFFTATRLEDYADYAETENQRQVAEALAGARDNGNLGELVGRMDKILEDIIKGGGEKAYLMPVTLEYFNPEPYNAAYRMNLIHASEMTRQMLHGARQSRPAIGVMEPSLIAGHEEPTDQRVRILPDRLGTSSANSDRRVFYGLYRRHADVDSSLDATGYRTGYRYKARGFYLGSERAVSPKLIAGFNFGYAYTRTYFDNNRGELKDDAIRIGPHATYTLGALSFDLALAYGWHNSRQQRNIFLPPAFVYDEDEGKMKVLPSAMPTTTRFDIHEGSAYIEARYEQRFLEDWAVVPMASLQYVNQYREGIKEKGGGDVDLKIESDSHQSLRTLLGMSISRQIRGKSFILIPELFAGWVQERMNQDVNIDAAFAGAQDSPFRVTAEGLDPDYVMYGGGLNILFGQYNTAYLRFEKKKITEGDSDTFIAGVKWNF